MSYVDGFVLAVPEGRIEEYKTMAKKAGAVWKEHGALEYKECVQEDMTDYGHCSTFPKMYNPKPGELIIFAFIVYQSREHRDEVNAKVMNDPRLKDMCDENNMPFDPMRMAYGGFKAIVEF